MSPTTLLVVGALLVMGAVGAVAYAVLGSAVPRISLERRVGRPVVQVSLARRTYRGLVAGVDGVLRRGGWMPFRSTELEQAGIHRSAGTVLSWGLIASVAAFLVGSVVLGGVVGGILLSALVPVAGKLALKVMRTRRCRAFEKQLDPTLRILASALRAGQSLTIGISSVAKDAEDPMSEELNRIVNENRIGRDLVEAMLESADRMDSEDFRWFAEAVEVQRDTGGNLNDIIDVVAETIRDRAEIREKINAYASEGKASMWVLMALPVGLALAYSVMRPGYIDPLLTTSAGRLLLALSVVLYGIGFVWMRNVVDIKV